jgi:hypothetical protein
MPREFASHEALIAALRTEGHIADVLLTPALASDILAHDPMNRDLRKAHVAKLAREISAGHWDPEKSPPMRFIASTGRLADGQHRSRAVLESDRPIVLGIAQIGDTLGLDQGAHRSLADQLAIHAPTLFVSKQERDLAATVTKAICTIASATDRELVGFFDQHRAFIMDCVRKPLEWLADKEVSVSAVFKPQLVCVARAQEILLYEEPEAEVDELLIDAVNAGATAPAGTPRQSYAKQVWDAMQAAHTRRGARIKDVVKWTRNAMRYKRQGGTVKNAMLARFPGEGKRRKKAA